MPTTSPKTSRVSGRIARAEAVGSRGSTKVVVMPKRGRVWVNRLMRAAIERGLGRDDVPACPISVDDGEMQRRLAAGGADRADAALERGDPLLQHRDGRVGDPAVDVAGALQVEQARPRGRCRGKRRTSSGRSARRARRSRVGLLPGVQAQRVELQKWAVGHAGTIHSTATASQVP